MSWSSKKQNSVALSTAEAEYISADSCCAQLLWMKATLSDFGIKFKKVPLLCDNESAIKLTNNPVQHAGTKHIDVHHHFVRDHQQKGEICIESVGTEDQLADIFTKPLDEKRFCKIRNELNILTSQICVDAPPILVPDSACSCLQLPRRQGRRLELARMWQNLLNYWAHMHLSLSNDL